MSRKAKRMYTAGVVGVLALGMLAGGVVIWQMHPGAATAGEAPPTPSGAAASEEQTLEPDAYSQIVRLRRAVRLSDGVVAAIASAKQTERELLAGAVREVESALTDQQKAAENFSGKQETKRRQYRAASGQNGRAGWAKKTAHPVLA